MKITLVTFHRAYNYGAVLQCYALYKTLCEMDVQCEVLDYSPIGFRDTYYYRRRFGLEKSYIGHCLRKMLIFRILAKRNRCFEQFLKQHIRLMNPKQKENSCDCDCYITGSDQVWHNKWGDFDPVYFLDFPDARNKKRYSYAASFGMTELPEELKAEYKRRLTGYAAYSVRERSGADIIKELVGREAVVSCDPTLLLKQSEWKSLCDDIPKKRKKYILIYYTALSETLFEKASELADEKELAVISLPCNMSKDVLQGKYEKKYGFECVSDSGPKEFLALFRDAEYILTNTFHGTVFSIMFRKQFLTQMRLSDSRENTRVSELFKELGITERDIESSFKNIDTVPDWDSIEGNIDKLRSESAEYLSQITENEEI